jgi:hypothetical protein
LELNIPLSSVFVVTNNKLEILNIILYENINIH